MTRRLPRFTVALFALSLAGCTEKRPLSPSGTRVAGPLSDSPSAPPHAGEPRVEGANAEHPDGAPPSAPPIVGAIGSAAPTTVEGAAADRRWLLFCQATSDSNGDGKLRVSVGQHGELSGDDLDLFLGLAQSEPERIEAFWGSDPTERWLIVSKGSAAEVIDTSTGVRRRLEDDQIDLAEMGEASLAHRALAFDSEKKRLLYARITGKDRFEVRARSLDTWQEQGVYEGSGRLWQMRASEDGNWLVLQHTADDTSGNGRLDLPAPMVKNKPRCHGPVQRFSAWLPGGDELKTTIVSLKTGRATSVYDLAAPFGERFLFRDRQGALWLGDGRKKQRFADSDCGAQVIHASPERGLVLAGCRGPESVPDEKRGKDKKPEPPRTRWPLRLLGQGLDRDLELDLGPTGHDRWPSGTPRLVALHAGAATRLLDMHTRRLIEVEPRTFIVATHETRALLLSQRKLTLFDAKRNATLLQLDGVDRAPTLLVTGSTALVTPYVVDLGAAKLVGSTRTPVLALGSDGYVLEAKGAPPTTSELALGPLVWRLPERP